MLRRIVLKELRTAVRNRQVFVFGLLVAGLLLAAGVASYAGFRQQREQMARAQAERRAEWLGQGEKHPHIATHFGTFVFKPKTGLSFFDYGLDAYTGTSVYLEAHYQHEFMFRPAQDYSALIRFGELSGALVLQVLLPLLVIFLCFGAITRERESGTLRLLLSQGVSSRRLAWGKVLAYYALVLALLLPTLAVVGGLGLGYGAAGGEVVGRLLGLEAVYAAYFFGFVCLCVLVSARAGSSRNALLTLLTLSICRGAAQNRCGPRRPTLPIAHTASLPGRHQQRNRPGPARRPAQGRAQSPPATGVFANLWGGLGAAPAIQL
ncbi:ABC transporter permease [Hymenobacter terrenus]|uniref:ABC transporter permease n=1 Tax=Hymenobacter terrenus TaxID=1629124 RepID=UPI0006986DF9|nr:ABC transporter permease subunit [Hymenobacter terrenus]